MVDDYTDPVSRREHVQMLNGGSGRWACDLCIRDGSAVAAEHKNQYFSTLNYPHLYYYDTQKECLRCSKTFTFSKEEKRHWYEDLKFYIEADAIHCQECRKEMRAEKTLNTELSVLLGLGIENLSEKDLERVIDIYVGWGKHNKVAYYRSVERKMNLKKGSNAKTEQ